MTAPGIAPDAPRSCRFRRRPTAPQTPPQRPERPAGAPVPRLADPGLPRLGDREKAVVRAVVLSVLLGVSTTATRADTVTVAAMPVHDEKAVFATVESANVVPARARIGGTVVRLAVKYGDEVKQGQAIATVGDDKLMLQTRSLDAQIAGLEAQLAQATVDLERTQSLFDKGTVARSRLDEVRTAFNVADNSLKSRRAERSVVEQQLAEGTVLAPTAGRVLKVPVLPGTVILAGETVAQIAEANFVLRLRVPERHAKFLKIGDPVRIDGEALGRGEALFGKVRLIYPQIEDGRVVADASVEGLGDYFVGERIRVWVSAGERSAVTVPARFVTTRFGIDYVHLARDGGTIDVPVQRGRTVQRPGEPAAIEILSGLVPGDRLVTP
ncbi:efflux RND transporter periplasmic adaptor subunit [Rhodoplanes sp. TEM]|uniref:Efflux RND transporter periplasmic adaptor subunit n=1 Tax=Rhodoplanes tepidamans TaxID=200616 RepID=A0ABT5J8A7_RHOTP|nr:MULTISPECIES: efflux RND transporter periplasmic adaptor subunit [Rhodoplanes]MDC7785897.1 efflux RND transporter periplasmic adaptor subunit [Rhodoplanes tepidamans]MDC7985009.1 efflux RND transporter periplasmic adaptor subunit [Rhodoplanes sp. TEM]MDQ0355485.1 RND family efflux transporter MFP subunit [Rhodoplanes tepidamans]